MNDLIGLSICKSAFGFQIASLFLSQALHLFAFKEISYIMFYFTR